MEIPFNYIILTIMDNLKLRNKKAIIDVNTLIKYLKKLIIELHLNEKEKEDLLENFDFEESLNNFFDEYYNYFEMEDNNIILDEDVDGDELWCLIQESRVDYDINILNNIDDIVENNTFFIEVLGININRELFNFLLRNEKKLEKLYLKLKECEDKKMDSSSIISEIKKYHLINRIMFINMHNQISIDEYDDLLLYSVEYATCNTEEIDIPFKIDNSYEKSKIDDSTIMRSLLLVEPLYPFNLRDEFNYHMKKEANLFDDLDKSEFKFYLTFLSLLEEEIKKTMWPSLKEELLIAKYRLMNSIDSVYSTNTFMGEKIKIDDINDNYGFIESTIFYFIKDLFEYSDKDYETSIGKRDLITEYYAIIKKLFIDTYYRLTNDFLVEKAIYSNKYYGIHNKSSMLLQEIINKNNVNKRKKI